MSFASPHPAVAIPDLSLYDYLFAELGEAADTVALIDGPSGASTSYAQLRTQVDALAAALAARGVAPGDVVGILCPNIPAFVTVFHGILRAGATATTINSLYTAREIHDQLRDAGARLLFVLSPLLPQAEKAAAEAGLTDENIIVIDSADFAGMLATETPPPDITIDPATHLAVLPYSSGTTGRAKGVMLTHRNLVANVAQSLPVIGVAQGERVLCVLPFFHIYGMNVLMNLGLKLRATLITLPRFELPTFLSVIASQRASFLFIAPPIAVALAKHPMIDDYDTSSVQVIFSGAAPLDGELGRAVAQRLGCKVRQGYGMSEMSPVSHCIPIDRDDIPLGTVGLSIPNMECKLVDPATGAEIEVPATGVSEPGELWCKGPNVMTGYLGDAAATGETLDADGFLHTGDVATVSGQGFVTVVDRVKELIKYHGFQVPPAELEALLLTHPGIADAAVIGVRDDEGEEIPKAFVVRQADAALSESEVITFVAGQVAPYKRVRQVEFIDVIPKSSSGKILRRELRAAR